MPFLVKCGFVKKRFVQDFPPDMDQCLPSLLPLSLTNKTNEITMLAL